MSRTSGGLDYFAAGGFWVDDFVDMGSERVPDAPAESIDAKYGITGLGEVKWVLDMLLERIRAALSHENLH